MVTVQENCSKAGKARWAKVSKEDRSKQMQKVVQQRPNVAAKLKKQ